MNNMSFDLITKSSLLFLEEKHSGIYNFWIKAELENLKHGDLVSACDLVYSLCLLHYPVDISSKAIEQFFNIVNSYCLYGTKIEANQAYEANAHLTAYILGTIQLLRAEYPDQTASLQLNHVWNINAVLDKYNIPSFPAKFTHHSWRVSHWLGGVPSIILNLYRETNDKQYKQLFDTVINSIEERAITEKGLIKVHSSRLLHIVFRNMYKLRHDPQIGDIGGIVHILWMYHFTGRRYKSLDNLLNYALELTLKQERFMESVPYCLDFDFIQLIRTCLEQQNELKNETKLFEQFRGNLISYLTTEMSTDDRFSLHKLPGALATLHECELYLNKNPSNKNKYESIDIIKLAGWL